MYMVDVTGWDARRALDKLQNEMGLKVRQEDDYSETITQGYVISYTPMQDTLVEKGDEVTIVISKGPEQKQVTVPPFLKAPVEDVEAQIKQLGLRVGRVTEHYSDEYAVGRVMWQSVEAGAQVDKDTAIDLWVSKGPEPVPTPEPTPSESEPLVEESDPPAVEPTQDVMANTSTQTITVDLSNYTGSVNVRIVVGDVTHFDGAVDADMSNSLSRNVTSAGLQMVFIYINGALVSSYPIKF